MYEYTSDGTTIVAKMSFKLDIPSRLYPIAAIRLMASDVWVHVMP